MDRWPDPGLARLRRYALAVWCWRARSRIACSPTKYAKPQWTSRYRSDGGRAERRMSGDRARKPPDMKKASRFLVFSLAILSAAGLASDALARGGHRGGRMFRSMLRFAAPRNASL